MSDLGVIYTARGADATFRERLSRFVESYLAHPPGVECHVYIIYKECTSEQIAWAVEKTLPLWPTNLLEYNGYNSCGGAGCFRDACKNVTEPLVCCLNASSEIMHDDWLRKLYAAFRLPTVGIVGCTGSYGFITEIFPHLSYPNIHIRGTGFLIERERFQAIVEPCDFREFDFPLRDGRKINLAYFDWEFGPNSMTKQIMRQGKTVLVAEKYRIIAPHEWGDTTYRGNLNSVLINDRGSRDYQDL